MPGVWLTNLYGPIPIGCFLKPSSPTCSRYFLGTTIPAGGRGGAIEGHEVGPGLREMEAHRAGIYYLNIFDFCLQFRRADPFVACEAKDHILSSTGITVVEFQARAQLKLVRQAIRAFAPRLRQGWPHTPLAVGARPHRGAYRMPKGVIPGRRLGRVEPAWAQRDVHGIHEFP